MLRTLALGLVAALPLAARPCSAAAAVQSQEQGTVTAEPVELAARYHDAFVTFEELDELVLMRFAESKLGRDTRLFQLKMRVIEAIGRDLGVRSTPDEIQGMLKDIERGLQKEGAARNIDEYLELQGVSKREFLESLRVAVLQTKLARIGLGIPEGQPVTAEQQEMWLASKLQERGLEEPPAPWDDGIVLRNGDVVLTKDEFIPYLRGRLDPEERKQLLFDILRVKRMKARMPDLDPEALDAAVQEELQKRKTEVQRDPRYKGLDYDQLLQSQGILIDSWPRDPNIVMAALSQLWVRRKYTAEGLREVYETERPYFDAQFGEALEAYVLFLNASTLPNEFIPRSFADAENELNELAAGLTSFATFQQAVELESQDRASRERKGYLGWVTRTGTSGPSPARDALFGALDSGTYKPTLPADSTDRLAGPVRTNRGVLLLWIGQRRPKPSWDEMIVYVHKTLRKRFVDEALEPAEVLTYE